MSNKPNPRKKKIDAIATKIAMFIVGETYTDEPDVQAILAEAIKLLDKASALMVTNDEKAAS